MQNNVTDLTQKLLGALDGDYNVTNMATIIEVITLLEKVTITKELLETTRLGKHINELRKHLANDLLAKRAKLLVKKWRDFVLVSNNTTEAPAPPVTVTNGQVRASATPLDEGGGLLSSGKKRPPSRLDAHLHAKKHRANGGTAATPQFDYDFSDNSNSSFKDIARDVNPSAQKTTLVVVNSDSNSSTSAQDASRDLAYEEPKKRGRKKGSKNHKNLIEEAESSFSNKMAVSRGNAKVKTTQELIDSLQNRSLPPTAPSSTPASVSPARNVDDWRERAAKLTERVSLIDQKLNSGGNRLKKHRSGSNNNVVTPPLPHISSRPESPDEDDGEDEIIEVVDDVARWSPSQVSQIQQPGDHDVVVIQGPVSLSEEEALSRLPPLIKIEKEDDDDALHCWCVLEDPEIVKVEVTSPPIPTTDNGDDVVEVLPPSLPPTPAFREHADCPARRHLEEKYRLNDVSVERVSLLHETYAENINGNYGESRLKSEPVDTFADNYDLDADNIKIVPNFYQLPAKSQACSETFKKYSISEAGGDGGGDPGPDEGVRSEFREYHECLDRPSYDGDTLRILPYVIID